MHYEEAIGVGRVISPLQREMLLELDNWPIGAATDYNREELIWKKLVEPADDRACGMRLTARGAEVKNALLLKALSDEQLLASYHKAEVESWLAERVVREMEDRDLVF